MALQLVDPAILADVTPMEVQAGNSQGPVVTSSQDAVADLPSQLPNTSMNDGNNHTARPGSSQTDKRLFRCALCGEKLATSSNLRRHEISKHSDKRPYFCHVERCKYATKGFKRKDERHTHIKRCHTKTQLDQMKQLDQMTQPGQMTQQNNMVSNDPAVLKEECARLRKALVELHEEHDMAQLKLEKAVSDAKRQPE